MLLENGRRKRPVLVGLLGLAVMLLSVSAWLLNPGCWPGQALPLAVHAQAGKGEGSPRNNDLLQSARFIQIPGPNPILTRGGTGAWDERLIEACDAFEDFNTYYLFYHGRAMDGTGWPAGYQIGVATAGHPLGPWTKQGDRPMLEVGPAGSWDDQHVACAMIVKVGHDKYYMWYSGRGNADPPIDRASRDWTWHVGLATASSPLGPWKKHEANPILKDFGYVGGVVFVEGTFYLYTLYPIASVSPDYGPMALATADAPEGPWTKWQGNPVLAPGGWGSWDEGGFSEAEVIYWEGVFHFFYGGAKYHPQLGRHTAIGYAYSFDGYNFTKYGLNPVASMEPVRAILKGDYRMMGEVHTLVDPPFVYLYHTIQSTPERQIGVQVLATQSPFRIDMPVLNLPSLGPEGKSRLEDCPPISVSNVSQVALTAEGTFPDSARAGIRVHVHSSYDGVNYDTAALEMFDLEVRPGQAVRKTVEMKVPVRFIKVRLENLGAGQTVSDVKVTATLGS